MTDPDNLILVYLRRMDTRIERLAEDMREVKLRLTAVETDVANLTSSMATHFAILSGRMDRIEARLDRVEQRLDLQSA